MAASYKYKDIDLNFGAHPVSGDVMTVSDAASVKQSIQNLVTTNFYERPFHPEIGSIVLQMLFENIMPYTATNIAKGIENTINNFEPRARLESVDVVASPEENGYYVSITYYILSQTQIVETRMFLEHIR